jgi:hypothetical protein
LFFKKFESVVKHLRHWLIINTNSNSGFSGQIRKSATKLYISVRQQLSELSAGGPFHHRALSSSAYCFYLASLSSQQVSAQLWSLHPTGRVRRH